jgi:hypothetical protein
VTDVSGEVILWHQNLTYFFQVSHLDKSGPECPLNANNVLSNSWHT